MTGLAHVLTRANNNSPNTAARDTSGGFYLLSVAARPREELSRSSNGMFHLAWFLSYTVQGWMSPWNRAHKLTWLEPDSYVSIAQALERAGFDYMLFEDGSFIPDEFHGSADWALEHAQAVPKHDPMTLIAPIGRETSRIGLIATMTTTFYPPFLGARLMTTLDHLTSGRVGVNLVTAHNDRTAQNYGLERHYPHDQRYAMASEWVEAVNALWSTWDRDALVCDTEEGLFADPSKVRYADFQGQWYATRGPLNLPPGPQGRPVLCQAGGSAAGKQFGARCADTVIAQSTSIEGAAQYRDDIRRLAVASGRSGDDVKVLFMASFVLTETEDEARAAMERRRADTDAIIEQNLATLSFASGVDFSTFDLDAPVPAIETNAAQSTTTRLLERGRTLREAVSQTGGGGLEFAGTLGGVADQMAEFIEQVGGDGFAVVGPALPFHVTQIAEGLAPELRRRGLIRDGYDHPTLRENLLAF